VRKEKAMKVHTYKGYSLVRNGTKENPWNIYKPDGHGYGDWVGYGRTLKDCKSDIDNGCFDK